MNFSSPLAVLFCNVAGAICLAVHFDSKIIGFGCYFLAQGLFIAICELIKEVQKLKP